MSTLLLEAFDDTITEIVQPFRVTRNLRVVGFRPLLVFINPPDTASLTLGLYSDNDQLVEQKTLTWAEIKTASDNDSEATSLNATYAYGYVHFEFTKVYQLLRPSPVTTYKLKLTRNDSYTYSNSNFIGWCKAYNITDGYYEDDPFDGAENAPFEFQLFEHKILNDTF